MKSEYKVLRCGDHHWENVRLAVVGVSDKSEFEFQRLVTTAGAVARIVRQARERIRLADQVLGVYCHMEGMNNLWLRNAETASKRLARFSGALEMADEWLAAMKPEDAMESVCSMFGCGADPVGMVFDTVKKAEGQIGWVYWLNDRASLVGSWRDVIQELRTAESQKGNE